MRKIYLLGIMVVIGVVCASLATATAFAWHPKGTIKKLVQNQSVSSGALSDANDAASAVSANPGDTLKYVIQVSNTGSAAENGMNDMVGTVLTDTLPAGIVLASDPNQRDIKVDLGTIKPGQTVTKEYIVKVTATVNGVIENKACFTGDSEVKDNPQSGCDTANVRVTVPQILTPAVTPAELPHTGPENIVGLFAGATGAGYALHRVFTRKRR